MSTNDNLQTKADGCGKQQVATPMRAFRLTLKLEADNREELATALHNMADQIERQELTVGIIGGAYSGAIYELLHDATQTHERYFREVQAYLSDKKASRPNGNAHRP